MGLGIFGVSLGLLCSSRNRAIRCHLFLDRWRQQWVYRRHNACRQRAAGGKTMTKPNDVADGSIASHCYRASLLGFALAFTVSMFCMVGGLIHQSRQAHEYRRNAMDLCAWHARRMNGDDPSSHCATVLWGRVVSGKTTCPFCGQKHDKNWISRNAWESQVNAIQSR